MALDLFIPNSWDSDIIEFIIENYFKNSKFFNSKKKEVEVTHEWDSFECFHNVDWSEIKDFMNSDEWTRWTAICILIR